jgi:DNA-binding NarL/FixJ family response regulator
MIINIVEDTEEKLESIVKFIDNNFEYTELFSFASYQSGLKQVKLSPPDILILDMTIPTFDRKPGKREGRFRPLGGYDLMRKLKLKSIKTKVIVLTHLGSFGEGDEKMSFEAMTTKCEKEFDKMFIGSIRYRHGDERWKDELKILMNKGL